MPKGKDTPFNLTIVGFLLAMTLFAQSPLSHGGFLMSSLESKLTCHFYHANIFHWAANSMALLLMRPSLRQMIESFPIAFAAMFFTNNPTVGFSAMIYAFIGLNIIRWKVSMIDLATFIIANILTIFMPKVAFGVHLASFSLGIAAYYIQQHINRWFKN